MTSPLRRARERAGLSRRALAQTVGISTQMLWLMEEREQGASVKTWLKLAKALDTGLEKLLTVKNLHGISKEPLTNRA